MTNKEGEVKPEGTIFPIEKEIVDRALAVIAQDPERIIASEGNMLKRRNNDLNNLLLLRLKAIPQLDFARYVEGALYTHYIVSVQALDRGTVIPRVSQEVVD